VARDELAVEAARRSSSAAIAHASTTSVPGRSAMCRSACSAIFVRRVSTMTSLRPRGAPG
jgi:hypothetical protein